MKKLLVLLILLQPLLVFGGPKSDPSMSGLISTFDVFPQSEEKPEDLQIELLNFNGLKKTELLSTKIEEFEEYTKYSLDNPYADGVRKGGGKQSFELFVFQKIKPAIQDSKEVLAGEFDASELRVTLLILIDSVTKKNIKTKAVIYYKEHLVALGIVDTNTQLEIVDDLGNKVQKCKVLEVSVAKYLLESDKRSLDLQIKMTQGESLVTQNLNIDLLNIKQTPIVEDNEDTEHGPEQNPEGNSDETSTDPS